MRTCTGNALGPKQPAFAESCRKHRSFAHLLILAVAFVSIIYTSFISGHIHVSHNVSSHLKGLSFSGVAAAVAPAEEAVLVSPVMPLTTAAVHQQQVPLAPPMTVLASSATESPLLAAAFVAEPTPEPPQAPFFIYTVQDGDTVTGVAARFGLSTTSILWNNLDLENADTLSLGQQIRVPTSDGVIYEVRLGDTLSALADYYGVSVDDIINYPANGLSSVDDIVEYQTLFIPGGQVPGPAPEPVPTEVDTPAPISPTQPPAPPPATRPPASSSTGFVWPAYGPVSSYFSSGHPLGIDIDMYNNPGGAIYASASGTVTFAGGNACCSYGLYVVINHGNGFETLYAHLGSITVSQGEWVEQGQIIGYVGLTGYTTGYHLHFEVHNGGQYVNPLNYLP